MVNYSIGVQIAWKISISEAVFKNSSLIEIDHIMLGILSLDKISKQIEISEIDYEKLNYEKKKLYSTLNHFNLDIDVMRRKLREMIPCGNGLPSNNIFHRSNDCKKMFKYAESIANNYLTISHLFLGILGWRSSCSSDLLITENIDLDILKSEIIFSFYKMN